MCGEFPVGTNRKGAKNAYGDVQLGHMHPGTLYIHSVHRGIDLMVHDAQLDAHEKEAEDRRNANKENIPPVKTQQIDSLFSAKIPSMDHLTQHLVDGILEKELFPETVEILLESESKEDMNSMISSLQFGGTDIPHVSDETSEDLQRARKARYNRTATENARKRANGEYVATRMPVKLAASERARSRERACYTPDCRNLIQFRDHESGRGYCSTCAPAPLRAQRQCSHQGCTKQKRYDGKCTEHVTPKMRNTLPRKRRINSTRKELQGRSR